jgi:hypothetical protein
LAFMMLSGCRPRLRGSADRAATAVDLSQPTVRGATTLARTG